jgi:phosphoglucomutase
MQHLRKKIDSKSLCGQMVADGEMVVKGDDFCYVDPVDGTVANNQGIRILFESGSRIIYRLSGTGSTGATIRIYVDKRDTETSNIFKSSHEALKELMDFALRISRLEIFTGRTQPTVIT